MNYDRLLNPVEFKSLSDPRRADRIKVTGNNTLWEIGPISEGVQPGDAVVAITRIKFKARLAAGDADHFGVLLPYPARLFYIAVQDKSASLQIDSTTSAVDFTERNGAKSVPSDRSLNKVTGASIIFADSLLDRDSKVQLQWVWKQSSSAN